LGRIIEAWAQWPLSARWISGVGMFWTVSALYLAIGERNPAAAFGESFVALGLHYGLMFGPIALGIWLGPKITNHTGKSWIAWSVGIGLVMAGFFLRDLMGGYFGVSDKLDGLLNSGCYTDWDGRSNPTVCD